MKRGSVVLAVLVAALVVVGAFEVYLFATYRMQLVNGLINLVVPSEGTLEETSAANNDRSDGPVARPSPSIQPESPELYEEGPASGTSAQEDIAPTSSPIEDGIEAEDTPVPDPVPDAQHQQDSGSGVTVYITKSGSKYHSRWCQYLSDSRIPISLSAAKARGYEPCKVCRRGW